MDTEITTARLAQLFDTTAKTIADLAKRGIILSAGKKGRWQRDASITGYVKHLRKIGAGRGGEAGADARARLGTAQAALAEAKAAQLRGELVEIAGVEAFWKRKLIAFRNAFSPCRPACAIYRRGRT